jgi:hypothetical protein
VKKELQIRESKNGEVEEQVTQSERLPVIPLQAYL